MSQASIDGQPSYGAERRNYQRYAVDLDALVSTTAGQSFKCKIRDYCLGGMLLVIADEEMTEPGADLCASDEVVIDFSLVIDGITNALTQNCRVARLVDGGLGVVFVSPDAAFIAVLKEFSKVTVSPKALDHRSRPPARTASKIRKAVSICQRTVNLHLPAIYREIFHRARKALLADANRESATSLERSATLDDIRLLESVWDRKESIFLGHVHKQIVQMVHKETGLLSGIEGEPHYQLALVDDNEFEDWLCVADLATRIHANHRYALLVLGEQLALVSNDPDEHRELPVAPDVFGSAIHAILQPLRVGPETQQIIFREAAEVLTEKLGGFYSQLIEELKNNNTAADRQDRSVAKSRLTGTNPTPRFLSQETDDKNSRGPVEVAPAATGETQRSQEDLAGLLQRIQQVVDQMPGSEPSQSSLDSRPPQDAAAKQAQQTDASPSPDTPPPEGNVTQGELFERLRNDCQIAESIFPWIRSLSQPLAKAAITDPHLFDDRRHPWQKIFNQLEHLSMYIDRDDQSQVASCICPIDELVEQVASNPQETDGVLAALSKQLDIMEAQCSREYERNVEQVVLMSEGLQRAAQAEQAVRDYLNRRFYRQQVPRVVTELLETGWLLLLERTYIREGPEGSTWKQYLFVLEHLAQRLRKSHQPASHSEQEGLELYRVVEYAIGSVSCNPLRKKALLDRLQALLVNECPSARETQPDMSVFEPLVASGQKGYGTDKRASLEPAAPEGVSHGAWKQALEQAQELFEGNRVEVVLDDGAIRSFRLVWVGDKSSKFVFVDHRGQKAQELDLAETATKIHAGKLLPKSDPDSPLIDRVAAAVLEQASR